MIKIAWANLIFGLCVIDTAFSAKSDFAVVYQWSQLEFDYPTDELRQADIEDGTFIPLQSAPIDVDVHYSSQSHNKSRVFVTIPRFQEVGDPVTFGVVLDKKYKGNNVIKPYPSWDWHKKPALCNKNRLISVFRVMIDECQRLWVMDSGHLADKQICEPQLLAFDLQTDQLVHKYIIPPEQFESRSIMVNLVVDVRDAHSKCKETFVYIADCRAYSIIVYDVQKRISWRVTDKTMYPYPNYGTFSILGDSFELMDGILGMSLSPYKSGEDRILFFHAMSSPTENFVKTSDLRNYTRFANDSQSSPQIFHTYRGKRNTQSASEAIDKDGIMYFGLMSDVTINCWNTHVKYGPKYYDVVSRNRKTLQFAGGVKVISNSKAGQELWVITSRFQKVAAGTISSSEVNFRILVGKTDELLVETVCRNRRGPIGQLN